LIAVHDVAITTLWLIRLWLLAQVAVIPLIHDLPLLISHFLTRNIVSMSISTAIIASERGPLPIV